MGDYTKEDAAKETNTTTSQVEKAWSQAEKDDAGESTGKTLDEAAPTTPREEVSYESLRDAESAQED